MRTIDKRVPFGFRGRWGKVYRRFSYDETESAPWIAETADVVEWNRSSYVEIGQDVQFKEVRDGTEKQVIPTQTVQNAVTKSDYRVVETTDAHFNETRMEFECIAEIGDIVYLFNAWWVVDTVTERSVFTPYRQTAYYIALKRIYMEIVEG